MRYGSLFSGIGGLDLGLDRAGMECAWQVEIDPYCRKVLALHWPDVPKYEDVRDVGRHNLEPVDLICGGFPCQDISIAGGKAGLDGDQSGLWVEFSRIIREVRPRYVVVENVTALLERGMGRVLGDLAACGYDAEWDCLPASAFGAAHRRDRAFIVAYTERERLPRRQPNARIFGPEATTFPQLGNGSLGGGGELATTIRGIPHVDGVPLAVVRRRIKSYGNAVVPQVAEWIGRRIMEAAK